MAHVLLNGGCTQACQERTSLITEAMSTAFSVPDGGAITARVVEQPRGSRGPGRGSTYPGEF